MALSGALSSALSGLRAAGRGAEVVSANISNALTPGYARRELSLSSSVIGDYGGVRINGIQRITDAGLASDKRLADAELNNITEIVKFFDTAESLIGAPGDLSSLSSRLSGFESALITASSRPDAPERLLIAAAAGRDLVAKIGEASDGIQDARSSADQAIDDYVDQLNNALEEVQNLNYRITAGFSQGEDSATLLDQRQQVIDRISAFVPVKQVPRDNGQIALYTTGGAIIIDGTPAIFGFQKSNTVTAYQSVSNNTLSGLTLNGTAIRTDAERSPIRGGSLGAQFTIRDEHAVEAQAQLDALSRDLIERFQDPNVDPSLTIGDAGLFTDASGAFNSVNEIGISSRIRLNASVDPDQGGEAWRIRDGVNALAPENVGNASILQNLSDTLSKARVPASGSFGGSAHSVSQLISTFTSEIGVQRTSAEQKQSYASARFTELTERQLADGVDTDAEIQRLLLIEQSYAANARMIKTVDELLDMLTRI